MIDVWLAGFASGAASGLKQALPTIDDETARAIADRMCATVAEEAAETVRLLVEERLQGGNGTHIFTTYVA